MSGMVSFQSISCKDFVSGNILELGTQSKGIEVDERKILGCIFNTQNFLAYEYPSVQFHSETKVPGERTPI